MPLHEPQAMADICVSSIFPLLKGELMEGWAIFSHWVSSA